MGTAWSVLRAPCELLVCPGAFLSAIGNDIADGIGVNKIENFFQGGSGSATPTESGSQMACDAQCTLIMIVILVVLVLCCCGSCCMSYFLCCSSIAQRRQLRKLNNNLKKLTTESEPSATESAPPPYEMEKQ
jgi:hypothetical protein